MSQDTTRTMRDSLARQMQMQQQQPQRMMTAQGRDSLIQQLMDSVNRITDPTIQQQLRDSVATLRTINLTGNQTNMLMQSDTAAANRQMQQQRTTAAQQRQMTDDQQRQATSDQRLRVQKEWPNNNNTSSQSTYPPANRP